MENMGGDAALKLHASGEDYLEAVLILQKQKGMYAPLISPGTWGMPNPASAMQ